MRAMKKPAERKTSQESLNLSSDSTSTKRKQPKKNNTSKVVRAKQERRDQFEKEALPHLRAVYNFALSLSRDTAVADDLTQDTFLHAFRGFDNYRVGSSCKAWLMRICRNLFIDRIRKHNRRPAHVPVDAVEPTVEDAGLERQALAALQETNDPKAVTRSLGILNDLFGDEVNEQLSQLPTEFREALLLCDVEGLSYKEIHEIMGTPVGTVRSRISRARHFLRERLESYARNLGLLGWGPSDNDETHLGWAG